MSLVNIEDFDGSIIAKEVNQEIITSGILLFAKSFGYMIEITPVMEPTPKGKIENSPNNHKISFVRKELITNGLGDDLSDINNRCHNNYKFYREFGYKISDVVGVDRIEDNGTATRWYKHTYTIEVPRNNKNDEEYVMDMLIIIMKTLKIGG